MTQRDISHVTASTRARTRGESPLGFNPSPAQPCACLFLPAGHKRASTGAVPAARTHHLRLLLHGCTVPLQPNFECVPNKLERQGVVAQLRCGGVLEAVRVSRLGKHVHACSRHCDCVSALVWLCVSAHATVCVCVCVLMSLCAGSCNFVCAFPCVCMCVCSCGCTCVFSRDSAWLSDCLRCRKCVLMSPPCL